MERGQDELVHGGWQALSQPLATFELASGKELLPGQAPAVASLLDLIRFPARDCCARCASIR